MVDGVLKKVCKYCSHVYDDITAVSLINTAFVTAWDLEFTTSMIAQKAIEAGSRFHLYYNTEIVTLLLIDKNDKVIVDITTDGIISVTVEDDIVTGDSFMDITFKTSDYLSSGSHDFLGIDLISMESSAFTALTIYEMGDVNLDGKINSRDVTMIKQYVVKMITLSDVQKAYANVYVDTDKEGNANISSRDAVLIQQHVVHMDVELGDRKSVEFIYNDSGDETKIYSVREGATLHSIPSVPEGYAWSESIKEFILPDFSVIYSDKKYYLIKNKES
jgi:hypothetical protein